MTSVLFLVQFNNFNRLWASIGVACSSSSCPFLCTPDSTHLLALFQQFGCHVASTRTHLQHHICGSKSSLPRGEERRRRQRGEWRNWKERHERGWDRERKKEKGREKREGREEREGMKGEKRSGEGREGREKRERGEREKERKGEGD